MMSGQGESLKQKLRMVQIRYDLILTGVSSGFLLPHRWQVARPWMLPARPTSIGASLRTTAEMPGFVTEKHPEVSTLARFYDQPGIDFLVGINKFSGRFSKIPIIGLWVAYPDVQF